MAASCLNRADKSTPRRKSPLALTTTLFDEPMARLIQVRLAALAFDDGRLSAGDAAVKVKRNREAARGQADFAALQSEIMTALGANSVVQTYVRPARWSELIFSRYGPGDEYGPHIDDPVMPSAGGMVRTDLSFTLFLSDPASYDGGELSIENLDGTRLIKLQAGGLVLYSTQDLHRVRPVTRGERLAAVGWVQSQVRGAAERETLFDLTRVRLSMPDGEARLLVQKSIGALMRLWGDV